MRFMIAGTVVAILTLAGCSSSTSKPAADRVPSASVATVATPTPSAASSSGADHTTEALECGMFDIGAVYINDEWPAIIGGHPRFGYALNLERAADTWQQGLNSYSSDPGLDAAIGRAVTGVHDMESAIAHGDGSAPVNIADQVGLIRDSFAMVSSDCAGIGYNLSQPLAAS